MLLERKPHHVFRRVKVSPLHRQHQHPGFSSLNRGPQAPGLLQDPQLRSRQRRLAGGVPEIRHSLILSNRCSKFNSRSTICEQTRVYNWPENARDWRAPKRRSAFCCFTSIECFVVAIRVTCFSKRRCRVNGGVGTLNARRSFTLRCCAVDPTMRCENTSRLQHIEEIVQEVWGIQDFEVWFYLHESLPHTELHPYVDDRCYSDGPFATENYVASCDVAPP